MTRLNLAISMLTLTTLACGLPAQVQTLPTQASESQQEEPQAILASRGSNPPSITIIGNVWVRDYADRPLRVLQAGKIVRAWCGWQVCYVEGGTVWRSCTSEALSNSKCLSR